MQSAFYLQNKTSQERHIISKTKKMTKITKKKKKENNQTGIWDYFGAFLVGYRITHPFTNIY